ADPPVRRWWEAFHDAVLARAQARRRIVHDLGGGHPSGSGRGGRLAAWPAKVAAASTGTEERGAGNIPALLVTKANQRFRLVQIWSSMRATFSGQGGTDSRPGAVFTSIISGAFCISSGRNLSLPATPLLYLAKAEISAAFSGSMMKFWNSLAFSI